MDFHRYITDVEAVGSTVQISSSSIGIDLWRRWLTSVCKSVEDQYLVSKVIFVSQKQHGGVLEVLAVHLAANLDMLAAGACLSHQQPTGFVQPTTR